MRRSNPRLILRNHLLQSVIEEAEDLNFDVLQQVLKAVERPYDSEFLKVLIPICEEWRYIWNCACVISCGALWMLIRLIGYSGNRFPRGIAQSSTWWIQPPASYLIFVNAVRSPLPRTHSPHLCMTADIGLRINLGEFQRRFELRYTSGDNLYILKYSILLFFSSFFSQNKKPHVPSTYWKGSHPGVITYARARHESLAPFRFDFSWKLP